MKIITVIPARGGSKSIPKKNIQLLNNKPLLSYSIEYSLRSKIVKKTIVSTDSEEISNVALKSGADVPFLRPAQLANDSSRDYEFMRHALDFFENKNEIYDFFVLLRPTSPLRPDGLIEKAMEIFTTNLNASSVRSVAKVKEHPYRTWMKDSSGAIKSIFKEIEEPYNLPRQELPNIFFQTGDIEVVSRDTLLKGSISGSNVYPLIINHQDMIDIDNWEDFTKAAEFIKIWNS